MRFVAVARPVDGVRPNELARTMAPHPLMVQELPYEPEYTLYNGRLTPVSLNHATADEMYWKVRREVILRHTGELPLEVRGPDAVRLLDRVFTRDVTAVRVGRCSYQIACYDDGGMINDGVLVRLEEDRFWYVQADGDLYRWFRAHSGGLDVTVEDPRVWVSQVQGPESLRVLELAVDGAYPDPFRYFDAAEVRIADQPVVITRTGFSNELGWEFYLQPGVDAVAIGERILDVGRPLGMIITSAEVFRARRIEAGLLNAGSDFDQHVTPFQAGLGHMVDLDSHFVGRDALASADPRRTTWGLRVSGGVAQIGRTLHRGEDPAGVVCSTGWSPFQACGVAIVRMDDPDAGAGTAVTVECIDGTVRSAEICDTPMYDTDRAIPRGLVRDIPA